MSDSEDFLQRKRERDTRVYGRIRMICVIVCVLWIPIALFVYEPSFLFGEDVSDTAVEHTS